MFENISILFFIQLAKAQARTGIDFKLIWIESMCSDEAILEETIKRNKLNSPDYAGVDPDTGIRR
jgi:hypothetical protein